MYIPGNAVIVINEKKKVKVLDLIDTYLRYSFRERLPDESEKLYKLRKDRYEICFSILDNRSKFWYNDLSDEQYIELRNWRRKWLDVTETLIEPETPEWIYNKLYGEDIL